LFSQAGLATILQFILVFKEDFTFSVESSHGFGHGSLVIVGPSLIFVMFRGIPAIYFEMAFQGMLPSWVLTSSLSIKDTLFVYCLNLFWSIGYVEWPLVGT